MSKTFDFINNYESILESEGEKSSYVSLKTLTEKNIEYSTILEDFNVYVNRITLGDIRNYIEEIDKERDFIPLLDFILFLYQNHIEMCKEKLQAKKASIWHDAKNADLTNLNFILLYNNIYQNLYSARKLFLSGFQVQASILFRSALETGDMLYLFLLDNDFATEYISPEKYKDEKSRWNNLLRPSVVKDKIDKAISNINNSQYESGKIYGLLNPTGFNSEWSKQRYKYSSKYVHFSDFGFNLNYFYNKSIKGFKVDINSNISPDKKVARGFLVNLIEGAFHIHSDLNHLLSGRNLCTISDLSKVCFIGSLSMSLYYKALLEWKLYEWSGNKSWS